MRTPSEDGRSPAEQLPLIDADARALMQTQQTAWNRLRKRDGGARASRSCTRSKLTGARPEASGDALPRTGLSGPVAAGHRPGASLSLHPQHRLLPGAAAGARDAISASFKALLPIPQQIAALRAAARERGRAPLPAAGGAAAPASRHALPRLHATRGHCAFRVLRDSDLEVEDEAEDLVREFETALKRRRRGEVIRLKMTAGAPADLRALIMEELGVTERRGGRGQGPARRRRPEGTGARQPAATCMWPPFTPRVPERVQDHDGDMFAAIRQKDMLLHHPYETFDMVIRFLQPGGAPIPNVLAIKQTLYRTCRDSPIVAALCEAAEAGKSVTALVELKARFDEAANIRQSRRLERAGRACRLRLRQLQDPRQDLDRGPARGRRSGHLYPLRHRQLPPDHRAASTPTCRSSPATRRLAATRPRSSTTSPAMCSPRGWRTSRSRRSR